MIYLKNVYFNNILLKIKDMFFIKNVHNLPLISKINTNFKIFSELFNSRINKEEIIKNIFKTFNQVPNFIKIRFSKNSINREELTITKRKQNMYLFLTIFIYLIFSIKSKNANENKNKLNLDKFGNICVTLKNLKDLFFNLELNTNLIKSIKCQINIIFSKVNINNIYNFKEISFCILKELNLI